MVQSKKRKDSSTSRVDQCSFGSSENVLRKFARSWVDSICLNLLLHFGVLRKDGLYLLILLSLSTCFKQHSKWNQIKQSIVTSLVDRCQVPNIFAIGDLVENRRSERYNLQMHQQLDPNRTPTLWCRPELTPVAKVAGKKVVQRLFKGDMQAMNYRLIATTVSWIPSVQPTTGSPWLTENPGFYTLGVWYVRLDRGAM